MFNEEGNVLNMIYLKDTHNEFLGRNTECWGTFNLHLWFSFCNMSNVFHEKGLQAEFTMHITVQEAFLIIQLFS